MAKKFDVATVLKFLMAVFTAGHSVGWWKRKRGPVGLEDPKIGPGQ